MAGIGDFGWCVAGPEGGPELADSDQGRADAEWIAMWSPAVAQPLVEWLRYAGTQYEVAERRVRMHHTRDVDNWVSSSDRAALAFARQVLGESLDHDWFFPYDSHPGARECSRCGAHDDSQPCH